MNQIWRDLERSETKAREMAQWTVLTQLASWVLQSSSKTGNNEENGKTKSPRPGKRFSGQGTPNMSGVERTGYSVGDGVKPCRLQGMSKAFMENEPED